MWNDQRTEKQCEEITTLAGEIVTDVSDASGTGLSNKTENPFD